MTVNDDNDDDDDDDADDYDDHYDDDDYDDNDDDDDDDDNYDYIDNDVSSQTIHIILPSHLRVRCDRWPGSLARQSGDHTLPQTVYLRA